MKSIVVKNKNGVNIYSSPFYCCTHNPQTGEQEEIFQSEDEKEQSCYQSLIRDIRRKEFDKNLISLLKIYLEEELIDWTRIKIDIEFPPKTRSIFLGISNNENIQWKKFEIELPDKE